MEQLVGEQLFACLGRQAPAAGDCHGAEKGLWELGTDADVPKTRIDRAETRN